MKILVVALALLGIACQKQEEQDSEAADTVAIPIGPGTDTSALQPPDTPMTPARESAPVPDTPAKRKR